MMSDSCFLCGFWLDRAKACVLKIFGLDKSSTPNCHDGDTDADIFLQNVSHSVDIEDAWDTNEQLTRTITIKVSDPSDGVTTREAKVQAADYLTTSKILSSCRQRKHVTEAKANTHHDSSGFICEEYILVSATIDAALEEQWNVVFDPVGMEKDRERGGLVLQ